MPESDQQQLKEGDVVDIRARVRCVVDPGTGNRFVCAYVDDPPGRGHGWIYVRVPIETVRRARP